ncbi:VOC family protein [Rhodococcus spelaei]|uniref:VOC family protein n=1 Tax=Rhodococcus spelaei TaxID=2546320 RepID=A0A541BMM3_9NOCA|nr:VOC family protein [Rhodococcus spelaei]TQF73577.1 VOC family protein [Rhodococcus spelaei]
MKITETQLGAPCWAELGTTDIDAAGSFYGGLLGWQPEAEPNTEAGGYTMMLLDDDPVAAVTPLYQEGQPVAWTASIAVADVDATVRAATEAGGVLIAEPMDVFDLGRFAVLADPAGAVISIWQGRAFQGAGRLNETGALCWIELRTRDTAAAQAFYTSVFGWTVNAGDAYTQFGVDGKDFGGMMAMGDDFPDGIPPHWALYFGVDDVDAAVTRATSLGAQVHVPGTDIPDTGRFALLTDPQGGAFAVYTPKS